MKKLSLSVFVLLACGVVHAQAPGALPQSLTTEILHVLSIISGYNVLMGALQNLFSKVAAPTSAQVTTAAKTVGAAAIQAAEAAAAQAATASALIPTLTAAQQAAGAANSLVKVLSGNT